MNEIGFEKIKKIIKEIPFFTDFNDKGIDFFSRKLSLRLVPEKTVLFKQGDIGDYLFFIVSGRVDIIIDPINSRSSLIGSFGPGASVGEMSLVDDYPRSATVLVTEPSELLILTRNQLDKIMDDNPRAALFLMKALSKNLSIRLRDASGRFADIV